MNYAQTIYLTTSGTYSLNGVSPFTLVIEPSGFVPFSKIYKIEYLYNDETKVQNLFPANSANYLNQNLIFPEEPGDPRNYKQTKTFYVNQLYQNYTVNVKVYQFNILEPFVVTLNLNLSAPSLENINGSDGYFNKIHLKSTRMYGVDNELIYVFESDSPNYLLPVSVNWSPRPLTEIIEPEPPLPRPYRLLAPYENEVVTSIDSASHIGTVGEALAPDVIDLG